jgi:DNA (cytosine-5)-methyltransferase 1
MQPLKSVEICAGGGGQALGLELAGFAHQVLVEINAWACQTLRLNRPQWNVLEADVRAFNASSLGAVDLLSGGVPCPPFSRAGQRLGAADDRDLFPTAIRLVSECRPKAVLIENVAGLMDPPFSDYRSGITAQLHELGYSCDWRVLQASEFGVPQSRQRTFLVAFRDCPTSTFRWPVPDGTSLTVGLALKDLMSTNGWELADAWAHAADRAAPTLVGGSTRHGGADLGPTRARRAWATLGVDGRSLANTPPDPGFRGMPRLTARMTARIQGFPDDWQFAGGKTAVYRQVGNALPPPVATAIGMSIASALRH